jgi:hypothetical protein
MRGRTIELPKSYAKSVYATESSGAPSVGQNLIITVGQSSAHTETPTNNCRCGTKAAWVRSGSRSTWNVIPASPLIQADGKAHAAVQTMGSR